MSDDIVARLRGHIAITTRIHYAEDGYPKPVYVHGPSPVCQEAADEIERLRKERDEAEPLLNELWERRTESTEMRAEIKRLRKRLVAEENAYDILRHENEHLQTDRNNLALEVERLQKRVNELENRFLAGDV